MKNVNDVLNDVTLSSLISCGFSIVFNQPYSYECNSSDINSIRSTCSASNSLCFGCYNIADPNLILTIACGNCLDVTQSTSLNTPNIYNGVYWYFTTGKSFGYSDVSIITQNSADNYYLSDTKKVSWHIDQNIGGWRCGAINSLNNDNITYYKIILKV